MALEHAGGTWAGGTWAAPPRRAQRSGVRESERRACVRSKVQLLQELQISDGRVELVELIAVDCQRAEAAEQADVVRQGGELVVGQGERLEPKELAEGRQVGEVIPVHGELL